MAEKSYRLRTDVGQDKVVKASLSQDIDFLEVLSLKINQEDTYKLHVSNYGIIVGRVLANDAFGIPNAKVSVFIQLDEIDNENVDITNIYPYKTIQSVDNDGKRYNLLPSESDNDCHRNVGSFPSKRLVLDNETEIEVYEKYWKYTTVTNQSGDYMIFGVPKGNQTLHVDVDLSDIGILSQKPRDFFYKGYNEELFDSAEQFKESTNMDSLPQILTQNMSVYVHPFFGESEIEEIAITRCDIKVSYKFEPTCVFLGSIVTDKKGQHIGHNCGPTRQMGYNGKMTTGEGTIEMIRKTPDGLIEEFPIKANHLIDGDGVWCYQIPMNLDYIGTDEFGNIILVKDSNKGIPTRTSVRFRVSMSETSGEASSVHTAKYLIPNVHELNPNSTKPQIFDGTKYNKCYEFGSATPNEYFRDLLWNKVYSVKNYIPRFQVSTFDSSRNYSGVRSVSEEHSNNVFPFNTARFRLPFMYQLICILAYYLIRIVYQYNTFVSNILCFSFKIPVINKKITPFKPLTKIIKCIGLKGEYFFEERADVKYFPGCKDCGSITDDEGLRVESDIDELVDTVQQTLAMEYNIVNLDFYNDWINGSLYMPLWYWRKKPKRKFLFGLFSIRAKNNFCDCDRNYRKAFSGKWFKKLSLVQNFATEYDEYYKPLVNENEQKYHKEYSDISLPFGVIKEFTNRDNLNVYYYAPGVPLNENYLTNNSAVDYAQLFATDIILLGSFNSCDLDNLPNAFDSLPSSTANVPFIATLNEEDTGDGVVSGLDWGHDGDKDFVKYGNGLVMDLECWTVRTRFKSNVNLHRLSELGVTLDMDVTSEDDAYPSILHDGMITSKELVDVETRAKFASLNHNGLANLRKNSATDYDTYKFHYIYPVNFDGHLTNIAPSYTSKRGINKTKDFSDNNYITYRLGEGKDSLNGRHKKHFYKYNTKGNKMSFPLFNNSFYFYFGLKEGNTAIDKFASLFNGQCATKKQYSFTIEYDSKPGKWCYDVNNVATDFGTIDILFDNITETFNYTLYNDFNEIIISETDVRSEELRFGYDIVEGGGSYVLTNNGYKKDGRLKYFKTGEEVTNIFGENVYLENGVYYLEVTNSFGMTVTQKINMIQNAVTPNFEVVNLGTMVMNNSDASIVCNDQDLNGELRLNSLLVDGEESFIKDVTLHYEDGDGNDTRDELSCEITCTDGSNFLMYVKKEEGGEQFKNFVCYGINNVPSIKLEAIGVYENAPIYRLVVNIWKMGDYTMTLNQMCDGMMNDNLSVVTFSIENGENFQAYINGIPFKLLENANFKENKNSNIPNVWLNLYDPSVYNFDNKKDFWHDMVDVVTENNGALSMDTKIDILAKQIEVIAKTVDSSYITEDGVAPTVSITTRGGKEPILYRAIHPYYVEFENVDKCNTVLIEESNTIEGNPYNAHITIPKLATNDDKVFHSTNGYDYNININGYGDLLIKNLGDYFAAFTNNGGFVNQDGRWVVDSSLHVDKAPNGTDVIAHYGLSPSVTSKNYPNGISGYFRHMFVDKRLSLVADVRCPINLNYNIGIDDNLQDGVISGTIINVIPMSYDNDNNIIGKDLMYKVEEIEDILTLSKEEKKGENENQRLYECLLNVGEEEVDLRTELKYSGHIATIDKQIIPNNNSELLNLKISNCKLKGELDVNKMQDDNGVEIYEYKSYVEGVGTTDYNFNVSNRINLVEGKISYKPKTSNKYIYVNGERFYVKQLNDGNYGVEVPFMTSETTYEQEYTLDVNTNSGLHARSYYMIGNVQKYETTLKDGDAYQYNPLNNEWYYSGTAKENQLERKWEIWSGSTQVNDFGDYSIKEYDKENEKLTIVFNEELSLSGITFDNFIKVKGKALVYQDINFGQTHISGVTDTINGDGKPYLIQIDTLNVFKADKFDKFVCHVEKDVYNDKFNYVSYNSPILFGSIKKYFGFEQKTVEYSNDEILLFDVTNCKGIVNENNETIVVNGAYNAAIPFAKSTNNNKLIFNNKLALCDAKDNKYNVVYYKINDYVDVISVEDENKKPKESFSGSTIEEAVEAFNKVFENDKIPNDVKDNLVNGEVIKTISINSVRPSNIYDVKAAKYGDNVYFDGKQHYENRFYTQKNINENPFVFENYWNGAKTIPVSGYDEINKKFLESPVVGEMHPYLVNDFVNENGETFYIGSLGVEDLTLNTIQYKVMPFSHPTMNNMFKVNEEESSFDENRKIEPNNANFYGVSQKQPYILYKNDGNGHFALDTDNEVDSMVFSLNNYDEGLKTWVQGGTINKDTLVVTCGLITMYNTKDNDNKSWQYAPMTYQNAHWNVGDMIFSNGWITEEVVNETKKVYKVHFSLYFKETNCNEDIFNALNSNAANVKLKHNAKEYEMECNPYDPNVYDDSFNTLLEYGNMGCFADATRYGNVDNVIKFNGNDYKLLKYDNYSLKKWYKVNGNNEIEKISNNPFSYNSYDIVISKPQGNSESGSTYTFKFEEINLYKKQPETVYLYFIKDADQNVFVCDVLNEEATCYFYSGETTSYYNQKIMMTNISRVESTLTLEIDVIQEGKIEKVTLEKCKYVQKEVDKKIVYKYDTILTQSSASLIKEYDNNMPLSETIFNEISIYMALPQIGNFTYTYEYNEQYKDDINKVISGSTIGDLVQLIEEKLPYIIGPVNGVDWYTASGNYGRGGIRVIIEDDGKYYHLVSYNKVDYKDLLKYEIKMDKNHKFKDLNKTISGYTSLDSQMKYNVEVSGNTLTILDTVNTSGDTNWDEFINAFKKGEKGTTFTIKDKRLKGSVCYYDGSEWKSMYDDMKVTLTNFSRVNWLQNQHFDSYFLLKNNDIYNGYYWNNPSGGVIVNDSYKRGDVMFIPFELATKSSVQTNCSEIVCDDGYTMIFPSLETIQLYNENGEKRSYSLLSLKHGNYQNLYISHYEDVDTYRWEDEDETIRKKYKMPFNFMSKINTIKDKNYSFILKTKDNWGSINGAFVNNDKYDLVIEIDNMEYVFPFIFDEKKRNFYGYC